MPPDIEACPDCESASIKYRVRAPHRYYCAKCGHRFDRPITRPDTAGGSNIGNLSPAGRKALEIGRGE